MAFGSWLKNLGKKIWNGIKKLPKIVKKVGNVVKDAFAPILGTIGKAIGGKAGSTLTKVSEVSSDVADKALTINDKVDQFIKNNRSKGKNIPSGVPGIYYK